MKSCEGEHKYAEVFRKGKEQCTQTETIFGLKDLPTVTEIVNNKIQEKKTKDESETAGRQQHTVYTDTGFKLGTDSRQEN